MTDPNIGDLFTVGAKNHHRYFDMHTRTLYADATMRGKARPPTPPGENEVNFWISPKVAKQIGGASAIAPGKVENILNQGDVAQIAYLDVGRWGGGHRWPPQRFFGLATGASVFLCVYRSIGVPGTVPVWHPNAQHLAQSVDGLKVRKLLTHLSKTTLGAVTVLEAATCAWAFRDKCMSDMKIMVLLGDLHLPVMTDKTRIDLDEPPSSPNAPARARVNWLQDAGELAANAVPTFVSGDVLSSRLALKGLHEWEGPRMTRAEAQHWLAIFEGKAGSPGADIFEPVHGGAAADLKIWCQAIHSYGLARDLSDPTACVLQLGDMYELWAGLYFVKWGERNQEHGRRFQDFWMKELLGKSHPPKNEKVKGMVGEAALAVQNITGQSGGGVLVGNHDDPLYMGIRTWRQDPGFYAEHGHQEDTFNNASGRARGWLITQLATAIPAMRAAEDPLVGFVGYAAAPTFSPIPLQAARLTAMERAIDTCLRLATDAPPWVSRVYAMGHTHRPCALKIRVRIGNPDFLPRL